MPKSNNLANADLNLTFCKVKTLTASNQLWAACVNVTVGDDGTVTITELSGNNYMRELVEQTGESYPGVLGSASGRAITNVRRFSFAKAVGGPWQRFNAIAFYDAQTGGNLRYWGYLTLSESEKSAGGKLVEEGESLYFDPGAFRVEVLDHDVALE